MIVHVSVTIIALIVIFTFVATSPTTGSRVGGIRLQSNRWKGLWKENVTVILAGIFLFHLVIYKVWPTWWVINILQDSRSLVIHLALLGFALMIPKGTSPLHHKFGRIGVPFAIAMMLIVFIWIPSGPELQRRKQAKAQRATTSTPTLATQTYSPTYSVTPENQEVAKEVIAFWRNSLPGEQAELMIQICYLESGFRQFEADGVTPYRGRANPKDVGVCQINEDHWLRKPVELKGEEAPYTPEGKLKEEYNINTLEGNLLMALWIYKKDGATRWNTYTAAMKLETGVMEGKEIVLAPVDKPGVVVLTPRQFSIRAEGPIWIYTSSGGKFPSDKGPEYEKLDIGRTASLQFQSRTSEVVKVTVIR